MGIPDTSVLLAYLLCILSAILCVIYGVAQWNTADDTVEPADIKWAQEENKAEEEL